MEIKTKRTVEVEAVTGRQCDVCGGTIQDGGADIVVSRHERGQSFMHGIIDTIDCCQSCWSNAILKLAKTGPRRETY